MLELDSGKGMAEVPTPLPCRGRRTTMEEDERTVFIVPAGVSDDDMHAQ
jgi:hypothetical protein